MHACRKQSNRNKTISFLYPSPTANAPLKINWLYLSKKFDSHIFLSPSPTSSTPLKINDHKGNKMGRWGRVPSSFPAIYKMTASLEEDRKPSTPEPFGVASNFLALHLAMTSLTYEMLVAFVAFLTFPIVVLFFGSYALPVQGRRQGSGRGLAPLIKVILHYKFPNLTKIIQAFHD